ncbi:hypothetical protein EDD36DRAFT_428892 [Exophiala viscosa]|uniref:C2H2-type domain-containing protein n=1 Tax=Exophiala viscosa TaxID=2486360 RepID=A0AAN6E1Q9_9EURO|nr:hypothetical protein EDD36DRAFT_428892 [Exophiala viscosa]
MANYASLNVCPTCSKSYKRPEHLRRHQISHGTERPHECMGCGNTFQRSDVLKRHLRTCDNLFDHPAQSTEPSVKRRALSNPQTQPDPTISLLDSYDLPASTDENSIRHGGGAPSFTNIAGWVSCGLSSHDFDVPSDSWQDFLNLGSGVQSPASAMSDERHHDDRSLNFLANFTSETGLVDAFDCGTLEQRRRVATSFQNDVVGSKKHTAVPVPACADSTVAFAGNPTTSDVNEEYNSQAAVLQWLSDPLSLKSHEIITSIKDVVLQQSKNSCVDLSWSNTAEEACLHFFSPMNIRRYIHFYWAIWHPNVNIMHKATFHSASAKPALVAAMSVMGACVSPEPSDREDARRWFNCVEELVFSIDDLCDDSPVSSFCDTGEAQWWRGKLRALQAAYMVCLYQNWEGTHSSKRRIRRYRYSTMVAAARDTLHNARHPNYRQQNLCDFSFKNFAAREELIRVCLWIFLLDTAFVIFNNLPPRFDCRRLLQQSGARTARQCSAASGVVGFRFSFRDALSKPYR